MWDLEEMWACGPMCECVGTGLLKIAGFKLGSEKRGIKDLLVYNTN